MAQNKVTGSVRGTGNSSEPRPDHEDAQIFACRTHGRRTVWGACPQGFFTRSLYLFDEAKKFHHRLLGDRVLRMRRQSFKLR